MSDMNDPGWDRPADDRHGPFPLNPLAVSATGGLVASAARDGLNLAMSKRQFGVWGKVVSQSGGLYDWYEVQDDGTGTAWARNYNGLDYTGHRNARESGGSTSVAAGTVAFFRRHEGLGGQGFVFAAPAGAPAVHYDDGTGGTPTCTELDFTKANHTLTTVTNKVTAAPRFAVANVAFGLAGTSAFDATTLGAGASGTVYPTSGNGSDGWSVNDSDGLVNLSGTTSGNGKHRATLQNGTVFLIFAAFRVGWGAALTSTAQEEMISVQFGDGTFFGADKKCVYGQLGSLSNTPTYLLPPALAGAAGWVSTPDLGVTIANAATATMTFQAFQALVIRLV